MRKKKILFGIFISSFLFLLVFFSLAFNFVIKIPRRDIIVFGQKENPHLNFQCVPIYQTNQTIIIRLDDIRANIYKNIRYEIIDKILEKNMSLIIGLVPKDLERDITLKRYLQEKIPTGKFEIAQHGYSHSKEEFRYLNEIEAYELLEKGKSRIYDILGIYPLTFIPPENEYSEGTITALRKSGFKIMSAKQDEYKFDGSIFFLGKSIGTYDFVQKILIPSEQVLRECNSELNTKNLCIIVIHPQDYIDNYGFIDKEKYKEFEGLIDGLRNLSVEFKVPSDLVRCNNK